MTETPISLDALRDRDHRERGDLVPLPGWFRIVTEDELDALVEVVSAAQAVYAVGLAYPGETDDAAWNRLAAALSRFVSEQPPNWKSEKPETGA